MQRSHALHDTAAPWLAFGANGRGICRMPRPGRAPERCGVHQMRNIPLSRLLFTLVLAAAWSLGGCSSSAVRLMPTPTLLTGGEPVLLAGEPDDGRDTTIRILYATNRTPAGPPEAPNYTRERAEQLRFGVATLRVGDGTKTWESLREMSTSAVEGERPEITLQSMREMASRARHCGHRQWPRSRAGAQHRGTARRRGAAAGRARGARPAGGPAAARRHLTLSRP